MQEPPRRLYLQEQITLQSVVTVQTNPPHPHPQPRAVVHKEWVIFLSHIKEAGRWQGQGGARRLLLHTVDVISSEQAHVCWTLDTGAASLPRHRHLDGVQPQDRGLKCGGGIHTSCLFISFKCIYWIQPQWRCSACTCTCLCAPWLTAPLWPRPARACLVEEND